jgi:arylsulfatase A-like enzyme
MRLFCFVFTIFLFTGVGTNALAANPNILFILVDDQSWSGTSVPMIKGDASSYAPNFQTPNVEKLAAQGMTFSQAYASHCKCECSRYATQWGRTTTSLNTPDKRVTQMRAPPSASLANTLKRANPAYRAAHLGKWQLVVSPEAAGYDVSDGTTDNNDGDSTDPEDPKLMFSMTRRGMTFMAKQVQDGNPFYLQMSYYAVHPQPQSLASTLQRHQGQRRSDMAAMTEDLDACVGALLMKLKELKIADNTLIIYMSDNGGRSPSLRGGKGDLGEGGLRVPLMVSGPGIQGGTYCNEPVIGYDILPTLVDLISPGTRLPEGIEGGSWRPLLFSSGKGKVQRPIDRFVFHQATEVDHPQSAIRKGNLKLIHYWDLHSSELFDLTKDKSEANDLAGTHAETVAKLEAELKAHVRAGLGDIAFGALERGEIRGEPMRPGRGKGKRPK